MKFDMLELVWKENRGRHHDEIEDDHVPVRQSNLSRNRPVMGCSAAVARGLIRPHQRAQ